MMKYVCVSDVEFDLVDQYPSNSDKKGNITSVYRPDEVEIIY